MLCCFEFKNTYFTVVLHIYCLFTLLLFYFGAASNFVSLPALILSTFYAIISSYLHFKLNNESYIFCSWQRQMENFTPLSFNKKISRDVGHQFRKSVPSFTSPFSFESLTSHSHSPSTKNPPRAFLFTPPFLHT